MIAESKIHINPIEPDHYEDIVSGFPSFKQRDMLEFHQKLEGYAPTPLFQLKDLAQKLDIGELWLKYDAERFGLNAFKGLGASYAVFKYLQKHPSEKRITFCTATDGNHGRAVAWAAKTFGQEAIIFVPKYTVVERIENIRAQGAKVVVVDGMYDDAVRLSASEASANGWVVIQDTAWTGYTEIPEWIMAGYVTSMLEMEDSLLPPGKPAFTHIFLQAGVGSWPASIMLYLLQRYGKNKPRAICVEPLAADGILESAKAGKLTSSKGSGQTQMAGLNCGTPSMTAFPVLKASIDVFLAIPDLYAEQAIKALYEGNPQLVSGESGAAGLAGLLAICKEPNLLPVKEYLNIGPEAKVLIICTEGATDLQNFKRIIESGK